MIPQGGYGRVSRCAAWNADADAAGLVAFVAAVLEHVNQ
jgi:hypothetical protein